MIKKGTLHFLKDVDQNNNREWFAENKERYEAAKGDLLQFIAALIPLLAKTDPVFSIDTQPKKCLLRIYRDVRFSKNKDPYKTNYGIYFAPVGKHVNQPGYYLHLQPGKSFFAGGYWMPEASDLKLIREEIDYSGDEFKAIVEAPAFTKYFHLTKEDTLKKAPKGYDTDHPLIDILKLKSFEAIYPLKDEEFSKPGILAKLDAGFKTVYPLIAFLRTAVSNTN